MIQPALVRRLSGLALLLAAGIAAVALAAGSPRVAGGIAAGAVLGLLPIVTWSYLGMFFMPRHHPAEAPQELIGRDGTRAKADHAKASPLLFGAISLGKLLVYASVLAILIGRNLVDPLAFAAALLAPGLMLAVAARPRTQA